MCCVAMLEVTQRVTHVSFVVFEAGAIRIVVKYAVKKGNVYYFRRRIPVNARSVYPGRKEVLFFSLRTSDVIEAAKMADRHARQQDSLWAGVRGGKIKLGPETQHAALGMLEDHNLKVNQFKEYQKADIDPDEFLSELFSFRAGRAKSFPRTFRRMPNLLPNFFMGRKRSSRSLAMHWSFITA